ncbi:hypothetical protein PoB_001761200 [Plakobranchus ocellatus]|uniref:Uncharacterized protein n=1 Tax=Plakobranchus ocellatus TaxID=259542 RepID=A0AAV3Z9G3_9GAST|nr:hypothetical protein PoB_001761200 [Plakobranchus ocellatus]
MQYHQNHRAGRLQLTISKAMGVTLFFLLVFTVTYPVLNHTFPPTLLTSLVAFGDSQYSKIRYAKLNRPSYWFSENLWGWRELLILRISVGITFKYLYFKIEENCGNYEKAPCLVTDDKHIVYSKI